MVAVTTNNMRCFAADCLKSAADGRDASERELSVAAARFWLNTANAIELRVAEHGDEALPDLRSKLN